MTVHLPPIFIGAFFASLVVCTSLLVIYILRDYKFNSARQKLEMFTTVWCAVLGISLLVASATQSVVHLIGLLLG